MTIQKLVSVLFLQFLLLVFVSDSTNAQYLRQGFYENTCPDAESIIWKTTQQYISRAPTLAAALLRMHFHDCFVRVRMLFITALIIYICINYYIYFCN